MDPIKKMIQDADPLLKEQMQVPDAEAALARMLADPEGSGEKLSARVVSLDDVRRRRRVRVAGLLTIAAAAVTAGALVVTNLGSLTDVPEPANTATVVPTATPTPSPTSTPTPSATASPMETAGVPMPTSSAWKTFTDVTGQATFEMPAGWFAVQSPRMIDGKPYSSLSVRNAQNKHMAELIFIYDRAAGGCAAPKPFTVLDSVDLDIPQKPAKVAEFSGNKGSALGPSRFTFTVVEGDRVYGSVALSEEHELPGTPACSYSNLILGPEDVPLIAFGDVESLMADGSNAPLVFDTVAEARAYMQTQEYQDLKRMLISLSLKPSSIVTSRPYRNEELKVQFPLPTGWTATEIPAGTAAAPAAGLAVIDEVGKRVATWYHGAGGGLGGACGPVTYPMTELDTSSLVSLAGDWATAAGVRFSYRVLDQTSTGGGFTYQVGLVDKASGEIKDTCMMFTVVSGAPNGTLSFADRAAQGPDVPAFPTMAEALAYMTTPEYTKLKEMITGMSIFP